MARKKKNDFWDEVEETKVSGTESEPVSIDEEWSAVKCLPLKIIMRFLLMVACIVALGSAYIAYEYVGDRYAGGSYSTDFYNSGSFAKEYNKNVDQLLQLIQAMEADASVTAAGNEEMLATLVENYMGKDTNFSFLVQDKDHYTVVSSGDDAKDRIEASNHYALISNDEGSETVKSTLAGKLLDKQKWETVLSQTSNTYIIYTAVDNELIHVDSFSKALSSFDKMAEYFSIARFVGVIAAVIFIICLIFCIMSTGMKKGYEGVCLTWFDRVFTEIALIIMAGGAAALIYGIYKLSKMNGDIYQYGCLALILVAYGWIIRSYFSIVRRIKAGRFLRYSLIGTIIAGVAHGIGKLPTPLNYIVGGILLVAINGGLVYALIFMRQYTVKNTPIIFIVAPIVFVIELLALLVRGTSSAEKDEELEQSEEIADVAESIVTENTIDNVNAQEDNTEPTEDNQDWERMDLGQAIEQAEKKQAEHYSEPDENPTSVVSINNRTEDGVEKTAILSQDEMNLILNGTLDEKVSTKTRISVESPVESIEKDKPEVVPKVDRKSVLQTEFETQDVVETEKVNFVQLNKEVRSEYKPVLKARGIGVTVRAPERPIMVNLENSKSRSIINNMFSQIVRLSASDVRNYIEVYMQNGKVAYITKITVDEAHIEEVKAASSDSSFDETKNIIAEKNGRFVINFEKGILKVGVLIDAAE